MDNLDPEDPHYERKVNDLQRRYDEQYDKIEELEEQIEEIEDQIKNIRQEQISGDNVYRLLLSFDELYDSFSEVERKKLMQSFIERIDIYPEKPENGCWIRNIVFKFPIPTQGGEVRELPLERQTIDETVVLMTNENNE